MSCYFIIMLVGVVIKCKLPQSFVFWELKNLFGVARELNGKAPHHPSPHADEKVAWDWDMCGFYDSTFWEKYTEKKVEMQDQIELPEIEGVSIPSYVRFLANGKQMHLTNENIFDLEEKPKYSLKNIQSDLVSDWIKSLLNI